MLNTFIETDTLVLLGRKPVEVTTQLIKEVLGLSDEGIIEREGKNVVVEEIAKKGNMHQVKDVHDPNRRA